MLHIGQRADPVALVPEDGRHDLGEVGVSVDEQHAMGAVVLLH
jgi:hypothetical protein